MRWGKRWKVVSRKRTAKKKKDPAQQEKPVRKCHFSILRLISSRPPNATAEYRHNPKWGRFPPTKRFHMDQIPLPFMQSDSGSTLHHKGDQCVWISQPGQALEKRVATLHCTNRPPYDDPDGGETPRT